MILSTRRALFIGDFRSWVSHAPRHETSTATSMRRADSRPAVLRACPPAFSSVARSTGAWVRRRPTRLRRLVPHERHRRLANDIGRMSTRREP